MKKLHLKNVVCDILSILPGPECVKYKDYDLLY